MNVSVCDRSPRHEPTSLQLAPRVRGHRLDRGRVPGCDLELLGAIVGIELAVERWEGVWKVSQNRTDTDRAGVVQGLMAEGTSAAQDMAALVRVA